MNRVAKVGVVVGGYVAAILAGTVAAWMYDAHMAKQPYDTSGGMYAGGQALTSIGAFLVVALVPTVLALWFLRRNERFWSVVGMASVAFAVVGLVAVIATIVARGTPRNVPSLIFDLVGLAQLLGVPIWTAAFVLFAVIAPTRRARDVLKLAVGIELVIAVFAAWHWFGRGSF